MVIWYGIDIIKKELYTHTQSYNNKRCDRIGFFFVMATAVCINETHTHTHFSLSDKYLFLYLESIHFSNISNRKSL